MYLFLLYYNFLLEQIFLVHMPHDAVNFSITRFPLPLDNFWNASFQWIEPDGKRMIASGNADTIADAFAAMLAEYARKTAKPDFAAAEFGQYFEDAAA